MSSNVHNLAALQAFYEKVLRTVLPHLTPAEITLMASRAAVIASKYAQDHPYQTGFAVLNVGLAPVLGMGWLTAGLLKLIGFGPLGPIAGSLASWYQASYLGAYIPAGSVFALLQKWAMVI